MAATQNSDDALRLLVVQRLLYSRAKRYLTARLSGMFLIATAAPIVGGIKPNLAVVCGAIAGAWLFAGRTYLTSAQSRDIDRAAAVQEEFDTQVFGMPQMPSRENAPSLEDVERLAGPKSEVKQQARLEKVRDWYPLEAETNPVVAVAICQRANFSYSDALLRQTARAWRYGAVCWAAIAIILCLTLSASFETVLLIVVLPLLPAFLDLLDFLRAYESASHIRQTTAQEIEQAVRSPKPIDPSQLLVWQERTYELRRATPLVPDLIYNMARRSNERAMRSAAKKLAKEG